MVINLEREKGNRQNAGGDPYINETTRKKIPQYPVLRQSALNERDIADLPTTIRNLRSTISQCGSGPNSAPLKERLDEYIRLSNQTVL